MKTRVVLIWLTAGLMCWGAAGCSNKNIDTAKVRAAFAQESPDLKGLLDKGLSAIDSGNYQAAVKPLQVIAYRYKLTPAERKVLVDTLNKTVAKAKESGK